MGARGPKRTPTPVLKARGSWLAATRSDGDGPLFPVELPTCPNWLCREAKAEWRRVINHLFNAGLIAKANRAALVSYCVAWGRMHEAETQLVKTGGAVLTSDAGNLYQNPWLAIANAARADLVKLAAEFGMTPASASRVTPAKAKEDEKPEGKTKSRFFGTVG